MNTYDITLFAETPSASNFREYKGIAARNFPEAQDIATERVRQELAGQRVKVQIVTTRKVEK